MELDFTFMGKKLKELAALFNSNRDPIHRFAVATAIKCLLEKEVKHLEESIIPIFESTMTRVIMDATVKGKR